MTKGALLANRMVNEVLRQCELKDRLKTKEMFALSSRMKYYLHLQDEKMKVVSEKEERIQELRGLKEVEAPVSHRGAVNKQTVAVQAEKKLKMDLLVKANALRNEYGKKDRKYASK